MVAESARPAIHPGCAEVACKSRADMFRALRRTAPSAAAETRAAPAECPPMREELGQCAWTLMHTLAAHYPLVPNVYQQAHASAFFRALAALYPCTHCREDFHSSLSQEPPRVESRQSLAVWLCGQHNAVNAKLGKPLFPCDFGSLDRRWRTGARGCFADETAAESLGQEEAEPGTRERAS